MSEPTKEKKPTGPTDRDKEQVEPVPKRQDFFEWLDALFTGSANFPERLNICPVSGPKKERHHESVWDIVYPPKAEKPTKEKLVALSNEILHRIQRDCDIQRRETVYGVFPYHFSRGDTPYDRFHFRMKPGIVHQLEGEPRDDDDVDSPQVKREHQILTHHEEMFKLYGGSLEGIIDRYDRDKVSDREEIARLRKENHDLRDQVEKALSLAEDRENRRAWNTLLVANTGKAFEMGFALAPPLLGKLAGKKGGGIDTTAEAYTLKMFFTMKEEGGLLTREQSNLLFGKYEETEPYAMVTPGVLEVQQAKLLYDVAHCNIPADALDELLPGGKFAISQEQFMAITTHCKLEMSQLAPLQIIMESRMKRKMQPQPPPK